MPDDRPTYEQLARRLARLEQFFDNIHEAVAVYRVVRDEDGRIVERILEDGNPALADAAGVDSIQGIIGKTAGEIFGRAYADRNLPFIREAMATGEARVLESRREETGRDFMTTFRPLDAEHYLATSHDITEIHRTAQDLRRSKDLLTRAQQVADMGSWEWDISADTLTWSDQTYKMLGFYPGEIQPSAGKFLSVVHPDDQDRVWRAIADAIDGSQPYYVEYRVAVPDGSVRHFLSQGDVDFDSSGKAMRMIGTVLDITERKRMEEQLRELSQRLTYHVDNSPLAVIEWDSNMRLSRWSRAAERVFGWKAEEVLGKRMDEFRWIVEDDQGQVEQISDGLQAGRELHSFSSNRNYCKDGSIVYCEWYNSSLMDESGRLRSILSLVLDVTERKRAEEALRRNEERMRAVISALPAGVAVMDAEGRTVLTNRMMDRIWAGSGQEIVSVSSIADIRRFKAWSAEGKPLEADDWASTRALTRGETCVGEIIDIERFDGTRGTILNNATPLRDARGRIDGAVVAILDITELRHAQQALKDADRRKDEFLAMLAHELRNPLAAISSAIQLMRATPGDDSRLRGARDVAERQADHMARLLDDLLDVSRVTQGKITLQKSRIPLSAAVESAMEAARPLVEAKGHRLFVSLPHEPLVLEADHVRLTQVISNLLNNAAKYTPPGGRIFLSVEREGVHAVVRVRDNGAGISPELLPFVFNLFVQADRSTDRAQGGLGIGLTMVRSLVEMHGGSVRAQSEGPGRGSEFTIRLPLAAAPQACEEGLAGPVESFRPRSILVVDDSADSVQMMSALLELEGHRVTTALGGQEGLDLALSQPPEVALIDIGMPGMDGFEVARRMRREPALAGTLLVALTGYGQEEDVEDSKAAGFNHHLVKPVDMDTLRRILAG